MEDQDNRDLATDYIPETQYPNLESEDLARLQRNGDLKALAERLRRAGE